MIENSQQEQKMIKIRSIIPIYYCTTTNTAKKTAYALASKLQEHDFLPIVNNVGDFDSEEFLQYSGPIAMVLATYGNGNSPHSGEKFRQWIQNLQGNTLLEKMQFSILALGNTSFEHFCGNGRKIKQCLIGLGAKQLNEIVLCSSASTTGSVDKLFPEWSDKLIQSLKKKYELREIPASQVNKKYKVQVIKKQDQNWQEDYRKGNVEGAPADLANYFKTPIARVIHIKQLRKNQKHNRSTLWIRLEIPEGVSLDAACDISVYPLNLRKPNEQPWNGSLQISKIKKDKVVSLPPIPLEEFWKLTNLTQLASINDVKNALQLSNAHERVQQQYTDMIKDPQKFPQFGLRCNKVFDDLKPSLDFLVNLGPNTVRPYTLASWDSNEKYFDLVVSLTPNGLTSNYFKSMPKAVRISPIPSQFYIPYGRPVVMIANGSGIAPFRSLTQYMAEQLTEELRMPMYLYYGIQNKENDFYFGEDWEKWEIEGIVNLRIAESRKTENKVYVQDLLKEDRQFLMQHFYEKQGVVFICGGGQMAKAVNVELFEAIKLKEKIPFKAFKVSKEFEKKKTIVKEIFD